MIEYVLGRGIVLMKKIFKNKKVLICLVILFVLIILGSGITCYFVIKNKNKQNSNLKPNDHSSEVIEKKETVKVIFDANGGSAVGSLEIEKGSIIEKPENPTREGYQFVSWLYNEEEFDFTTSIQENIILKAKWEKKEEATDPSSSGSNKQNNLSGTTSGTSSGTSSSSSNIDKFNLNDNVSVTFNFMNWSQPGGYYFITNMDSVLPQLTGKKSITVGWDEDKVGNGIDVLLTDWEDALQKFTFDTAKEENAKAVFQKIESANQQGIQFTPNISDHQFSYKYTYLTVSHTSYHSLNSAFKANKNNLQNEIDRTFSDAVYVILPGYGVYPSYDELLTEEICNEYHLVCSKW